MGLDSKSLPSSFNIFMATSCLSVNTTPYRAVCCFIVVDLRENLTELCPIPFPMRGSKLCSPFERWVDVTRSLVVAFIVVWVVTVEIGDVGLELINGCGALPHRHRKHLFGCPFCRYFADMQIHTEVLASQNNVYFPQQSFVLVAPHVRVLQG